MTKKSNQLVDIDFVRKVAGEFGMKAHDLEAIQMIYPGFTENVIESVSARFAGRAVPEGKVEEVRRHVAALIIDGLWRRRGIVDSDTEARVQAAHADALAWLAQSKTVAEVRASQRPPPGALTPADDDETSR